MFEKILEVRKSITVGEVLLIRTKEVGAKIKPRTRKVKVLKKFTHHFIVQANNYTESFKYANVLDSSLLILKRGVSIDSH